VDVGNLRFLSGAAIAAFIAIPVLSLAPSAAANLLVDTGPGSNSSTNSNSVFNNTNGTFQYLAGQFTLTSGAIVDRADGWFGPFSSGASNARIYTDDNGLPGTPIYSTTGTVPFSATTSAFSLFGGLKAALPAGTYWVSFEPPLSGLSGNMPGGAPTPLAKYAFFANSNNRWVSLSPTVAMNQMGFRLDGRASDILAGSAAKGTYREDIPINGNPDGLSATSGGNGQLNTTAAVGNGVGHGAVVGNVLEAGALARGFADALITNAHSGLGTGHGIAWRPFTNATAQPVTFRMNAVLDGSANNGFGTLICHVDSLVAAFDAQTLATRIHDSGQDAGAYLLALHSAPGAYTGLGANGLLGDAVLNDQFNADASGAHPKNYSLQSNTFTLAPGRSFVMLFDVYVDATGQFGFGGGTGEVDFLHTLHAATNLFTDAAGNPVTGIVPGMADAIAVPEPASIALLAAAPLLLRRRSRSLA
jgi:hypothetical protein